MSTPSGWSGEDKAVFLLVRDLVGRAPGKSTGMPQAGDLTTSRWTNGRAHPRLGPRLGLVSSPARRGRVWWA